MSSTNEQDFVWDFYTPSTKYIEVQKYVIRRVDFGARLQLIQIDILSKFVVEPYRKMCVPVLQRTGVRVAQHAS